MRDRPSARLTIIGAGPAGIGLLVAASNAGQLHRLFGEGVRILEQRDDVGAGALGAYDINSDSHADSFLQCLDAGLAKQFPELSGHPATRALQEYRGRGAPLPLAADFIAAIARSFQFFAARMGQPIATGTQALSARRGADGSWLVRTRRRGIDMEFASRDLVIATGAEPSTSRLRCLHVAGQAVWPRHKSKLILSRAILTTVGLQVMRRMLAQTTSPRVAIIGGSHSAMAAANALLSLAPGVAWTPASITVLHRRPLRPMYQSPELARAEGFDTFAPEDICPKTSRVFPLAGFRSDSRELLLRIMGLGGRSREERVALQDLDRCDARSVAETFERADVIIAATGYRPRALPLFDRRGRRIGLQGEGFGSPALVDDQSRVLDRAGRPIPGLFGLGLSAGFPLAATHGEPSFRGEANGLALWHGEIGAAIVAAVLRDRPQAPAQAPALGGTRPAMHNSVDRHGLQARR